MKKFDRKDLARNIELAIWNELKGIADDGEPFEWCVEFSRDDKKHLLDQDDTDY